MSKADKIFEKLGFTKNMSECYNETHVLYEKSVMNDSDILTIEFKDGKYLYTSLHLRAIWTYGALLKAINLKMKELGWLE